MKQSLPRPSRHWLWLLPVIAIGFIAVVRWNRAAEAEANAPRKLPAAKSIPERSAESMPKAATASQAPAPAAPDFSAAIPPAIPAGHEGHGDECAACAAERGLAACREDYAQMEYARLLDQLDADEPQAKLLLEGCRRLAAAVVKDWSHAKSRPEMPADSVIADQRQAILEPLLATIPRKPSAE